MFQVLGMPVSAGSIEIFEGSRIMSGTDSTAGSKEKSKWLFRDKKSPKKVKKVAPGSSVGSLDSGEGPGSTQRSPSKEPEPPKWLQIMESIQNKVGNQKITSKCLEELSDEWLYMKTGMLYVAENPIIDAMRHSAQQKCYMYNSIPVARPSSRTVCLKDTLGSTGEQVVVEPPFMCDYGINIHVGENFYANFNCCILDGADVTIGDDVMFGPAVHVYTAHHPIEPALRYDGKELCHPVSIGNRVWVGGRAVINPGVVIGDDVVIGAGSVVTKDVPSGVVVAGNPAVIIRRLDLTASADADTKEMGFYCERRAQRRQVASRISPEDRSLPARKLTVLRSKSFEEEEREEAIGRAVYWTAVLVAGGGLAAALWVNDGKGLPSDLKKMVSAAKEATNGIFVAGSQLVSGALGASLE